VAKKIVIDEVHGAQGAEMSDEDVAELETDTRSDTEVEAEPSVETPVDEDLPEGITEPPEVPEPAEPEVDPDVERLKELKLYRPGLIETTEDALQSLKWHEQHKEEYVEKARQEVAPQVDPERIMEELQDEIQTNPVSAMVRIANAMQEGNRSEINKLKEDLFYGNSPDAKDFRGEIGEIQKEIPGLGMQDAYDLARGRNSDKVIAQATQVEKRRATEKQVALREKPGGVRTAPVDAAQAVKDAAAGGGSAQETVNRMIKVLEAQNMGAKD
jgi:hypothetical protein